MTEYEHKLELRQGKFGDWATGEELNIILECTECGKTWETCWAESPSDQVSETYGCDMSDSHDGTPDDEDFDPAETEHELENAPYDYGQSGGDEIHWNIVCRNCDFKDTGRLGAEQVIEAFKKSPEYYEGINDECHVVREQAEAEEQEKKDQQQKGAVLLQRQEIIERFNKLDTLVKQDLLACLCDTITQEFYTLVAVDEGQIRITENLDKETAKLRALEYEYYKVVLCSHTPVTIYSVEPKVEFKYKGQERK